MRLFMYNRVHNGYMTNKKKLHLKHECSTYQRMFAYCQNSSKIQKLPKHRLITPDLHGIYFNIGHLYTVPNLQITDKIGNLRLWKIKRSKWPFSFPFDGHVGWTPPKKKKKHTHTHKPIRIISGCKGILAYMYALIYKY